MLFRYPYGMFINHGLRVIGNISDLSTDFRRSVLTARIYCDIVIEQSRVLTSLQLRYQVLYRHRIRTYANIRQAWEVVDYVGVSTNI